MKIDRLLKIVFYLLNNENVSARDLAERFHVSVRTIQRDMVSIAEAGIPVYSNQGKNGGYSILPSYRVRNCNIHQEEQQLIRQALESLATSYANETLAGLIEKYHLLLDRNQEQSIFFDFGIARENQQVQKWNQILEQAIEANALVEFFYRDAQGRETQRLVEPLAMQYKWYSWYLFAWSVPQEVYRTFKVARIRRLQITSGKSDRKHPAVKELLKHSDRAYGETCVTLEVDFDKKDTCLMEEYFPDSRIEERSGEKARIWIQVPPGERFWKALLLSMGSHVEIISPEIYRNELIRTAQNFLSNYDI
nr:WYL domain-containing protein [uncultured Blautia sp.]